MTRARSASLPRRIQLFVLGSWSGLLIVLWCWTLSPQPTRGAMAWGMLYSLPLLAPLYGLLRGSRYTHAWATLCVLPHLVIGITESVANASTRLWAGLMLAASLLLFVGLVAYLRVTR